MKERYQIGREQAVRKFQKQAQHSEESLQLTLPLKEVAAMLQDGVGELMRQAGLQLMQLVMEDELSIFWGPMPFKVWPTNNRRSRMGPPLRKSSGASPTSATT